jgi:hypothetical protein
VLRYRPVDAERQSAKPEEGADNGRDANGKEDRLGPVCQHAPRKDEVVEQKGTKNDGEP